MTGGTDNTLHMRAGSRLPDEEPHAGPGGFDEFVRVQYRGLLKFLRRRTGTPQDAEDVAQEALQRLLRYRESESAAAWRPLLYRIAVNVSHDHARLNAPYHDGRHVGIEHCDLADELPTPEEQAHIAQQRERLREAILSLPSKCQRVYLLKRGHGLSHVEVARRCGISVKMVDKHLANAFLHLQRKVGSDGGRAS